MHYMVLESTKYFVIYCKYGDFLILSEANLPPPNQTNPLVLRSPLPVSHPLHRNEPPAPPKAFL